MFRRYFNPHFVARMCFIGFFVALGACSTGNELGVELPVRAAFPKINDVPKHPDGENVMSPNEKDALLQEMLDLQQNHGTDAENAIEAQ